VTLAAAPAFASNGAVYTGGKTGDYYQGFGPGLAKIVGSALWQDHVPVVETHGTPDNMDRVLGDPNGVGLFQGNVWAKSEGNPKYAGHLVPVRADVAQETVLAVMSESIYGHSKGSWEALAAHASRVRFVTGPEDSGPGATWKQFQELDKRLLATKVVYADSVDDALKAVADGDADVALMVQFANPDNARFAYIKDHKLKVAGVVFPQMRGLALPGLEGMSAFELCTNVPVEFQGGFFGIGSTAVTVDTACTPLVFGVNSTASPDLIDALKSAPASQLMPPANTGLGAVLARVKTVTGDAYKKALSAAESVSNQAQSW
jgi:hypothetical protein